MSESKHTPGPWEWSIRTADESPATLFMCDDCGVDTDIAAMLEDCDFDTQWANARLIAAAPDLLAACKETVEFNREVYVDINDWPQHAKDCIAAITRAEQEQK